MFLVRLRPHEVIKGKNQKAKGRSLMNVLFCISSPLSVRLWLPEVSVFLFSDCRLSDWLRQTIGGSARARSGGPASFAGSQLAFANQYG